MSSGGDKKLPARTMCCLFVSVMVFTMLVSYVGLTRASAGRAFDRENAVYKRNNSTQVVRHVHYSRYGNKAFSSDYRHSRQHVIYSVIKCCVKL